MDLEIKVDNQKYARIGQNKASEAIKSIPQVQFITLGNISEQEKVEIIKLGFQRNQEKKISLKNYYQGKGESTLFQWKGYQIKYDTIRKTKVYQQLKFGLRR